MVVSASKAKFISEVKAIEEQIELAEVEKNDGEEFEFGALENLIERTDEYNEILSIENGKLVYNAENISENQAKWLEDINIHSRKGIIPIYTREQLSKIGSNEEIEIKETGQTYRFSMDAHYILQNDIDLEGSQTNPWKPIGTDNNYFSGIFDGGNYIIDGIYFLEEPRKGIFGYNSGIIKNIITGNSSPVTSYCYMTGIIVAINKGEISNCINNTVYKERGSYYAGSAGIAYQNYGTISQCANNAEIIGGIDISRNLLSKLWRN